MTQPPEVAQAMFVRDIAPELARDRDFLIKRESPGELLFSDGDAPGRDVGGEPEEGSAERADLGTPDAPIGGDLERPRQQMLNARLVPDELSDLFARHIHVDFGAQAAGTRVRVHGRVERDVGHAVERLGSAQHWPETADLPHD